MEFTKKIDFENIFSFYEYNKDVNANLYKHINEKYYVFLKEININKDKLDNYKNQINQRIHINNNFIANIIGTYYYESNDNIIFNQIYKFDFTRINQKLDNNELFKLFSDINVALCKLQEYKLTHGDLKLKYFRKRDDNYILVDRWDGEENSNILQKNNLKKKIPSFISPQIYQCFLKKSKIRYQPFKSESFSLALNILGIFFGSLKNIYKSKEFNENSLNNYIKSFINDFSLHDKEITIKFKEVIKNSLLINEKTRWDSIKIRNYLNGVNEENLDENKLNDSISNITYSKSGLSSKKEKLSINNSMSSLISKEIKENYLNIEDNDMNQINENKSISKEENNSENKSNSYNNSNDDSKSKSSRRDSSDNFYSENSQIESKIDSDIHDHYNNESSLIFDKENNKLSNNDENNSNKNKSTQFIPEKIYKSKNIKTIWRIKEIKGDVTYYEYIPNLSYDERKPLKDKEGNNIYICEQSGPTQDLQYLKLPNNKEVSVVKNVKFEYRNYN